MMPCSKGSRGRCRLGGATAAVLADDQVMGRHGHAMQCHRWLTHWFGMAADSALQLKLISQLQPQWMFAM